MASFTSIRLCAAVALLCVLMVGALAWADNPAQPVGKLSGSNTVSLTVADLTLSSVGLSDVFSISYRVQQFSVTSQTSFGTTGLASATFRLSTRLGEYNLQGGTSFSSKTFTRSSFSLSGTLSGVAFVASLVGANLGSDQTPSYGFGTTIRAYGNIPELGRLTAVLGIGATPFGQVQTGSCFEGARVSWGDLSLCGGKAGVDLAFGDGGLEEEYVSWMATVPALNASLRIGLPYEGLFELQGLTVGLFAKLGCASASSNWSFANDFSFLSGSAQLSGPAWDGNLSSSATFNATGLLSLAASWNCTKDQLSVFLSPEIEIVALGPEFTLSFNLPSIRVDLRYDLTCCEETALGRISIGQVACGFRLSETGFHDISATYSYSF
jgi:hypothetical protein